MIEHRPKWTGSWTVRLEDASGRDVICQEEQPEALLPFNGWRRKIVFLADLPGVGAAYYKVKPVEIETAVCSRAAGADFRKKGFRGFWPSTTREIQRGTDCRSFGDPAGIFEPIGPAKIPVENGPVRTVFESEWAWRHSRAVLQTIAYPDLGRRSSCRFGFLGMKRRDGWF